jgi:hypothetical protein
MLQTNSFLAEEGEAEEEVVMWTLSSDQPGLPMKLITVVVSEPSVQMSLIHQDH